MLDHRLVQTALIGHENSDHPVILPMDAWELDRWRKTHPAYSYWCGLQLGGCGGELSDRRYTTKVCHFAHHPTAPGPALAQYSDTGRRDLLVAVDSPLREYVPVLSALIRDRGEPLPYLFRVLSELGVPRAAVSHRIKRWAAVETERAFAAYGVPARAMPPTYVPGTGTLGGDPTYGRPKARRLCRTPTHHRPAGGDSVARTRRHGVVRCREGEAPSCPRDRA